MKTSRLDNVLRRNRRNTILDVLLVAFILVGVLFTGLAFGQELPKLTSAPVATGSAAEAAPIGDAGMLQPAAAPVRLARR